MMPANAHTCKKFSRMCFEKSEVTLAEKKILNGCEQAPFYSYGRWQASLKQFIILEFGCFGKF